MTESLMAWSGQGAADRGEYREAAGARRSINSWLRLEILEDLARARAHTAYPLKSPLRHCSLL
jgi:hypothetical protein